MTNQVLSNDVNLILESCKIEKDNNLIEEKINQVEDWNSFIDISYFHGVFPLIYYTLKNFENLIPTDILLKMKSINMDIVKQNMLMTSELFNVINILEENGIEVITFKGPTLSQLAYNDITLRQYVDVDLLIDKKSLKNVSKVLLDSNFVTNQNLNYLNNELYIDKCSDIQFFHEKTNTLFEVHWKLFRNQFSKKINLNEIFFKKIEIKINNRFIKTFSVELLLVYLCMHGSKHLWERIEWIVDIDKLIRNSKDLNWDKVLEYSKLFESKVMLDLGLYLSNKYFQTKIPYEIENKKYNIFLEQEILKSIISINNSKTEFQKNYYHFKFHYYLNDTIILKVKFIYKTLFLITNSDVILINLPNSLYFIYYFIKPFRLLNKYISKIFK